MFSVVLYKYPDIKIYGLLGIQFLMVCYHCLVFPFERRKQQQVIIFNESALLIVILLAVHLEKTVGKWRKNFNYAFSIFYLLFILVNTVYVAWRYYKILNGTDGIRGPKPGGQYSPKQSKLRDPGYNSYAQKYGPQSSIDMTMNQTATRSPPGSPKRGNRLNDSISRNRGANAGFN